MKISNLEELLVDEMRDIYHAEKQLVKALPKMAKAASTPGLWERLRKGIRPIYPMQEHAAMLVDMYSSLLVEAPV